MENRLSPRGQEPGAGSSTWLERFSPRQEKLLLTALVFVYAAIGYFFLGLTASESRAITLAMPREETLPLVPAFIWVYAGVYTAMFYPAFVIRDRHLFRRLIQAYLLGVTVSFVTYALLPVTGTGLRPSLDHLDLSVYHNWALKVLYTLDPPYNMFPSLHMMAAGIAVFSAWKARPLYGWLAVAPAASIGLAIVLLKQHFIADGIAGLLLAVLCYRWTMQDWQPAPGAPSPAYGWRGPASFLLLLGSFYICFYLAFRSGWQPWG